MWQILSNDGKPSGKPTEFPPIQQLGLRVCYTNTVYTRLTLEKFRSNPLQKIDDEKAHAEAVICEELSRFRWDIKVWGDTVDEVSKMLDRILEKIKLPSRG